MDLNHRPRNYEFPALTAELYVLIPQRDLNVTGAETQLSGLLRASACG